eukprot:scaffold128580_cov72-Phaeocystis_antarctica.AAC.2
MSTASRSSRVAKTLDCADARWRPASMCRLCDAYSLLPNRWMMVNPRATRDTVVQGFERPRAPRAPRARPAFIPHYALCADVRGESGELVVG